MMKTRLRTKMRSPAGDRPAARVVAQPELRPVTAWQRPDFDRAFSRQRSLQRRRPEMGRQGNRYRMHGKRCWKPNSGAPGRISGASRRLGRSAGSLVSTYGRKK